MNDLLPRSDLPKFLYRRWMAFFLRRTHCSFTVIILIWLHAECFLSCRWKENCVLYLLILVCAILIHFNHTMFAMQWVYSMLCMLTWITLITAFLAGVWLQDGNNFLVLSDCSGVPCLWKAFFNLSPWFSESRERFSTVPTTSWINNCKYKIR